MVGGARRAKITLLLELGNVWQEMPRAHEGHTLIPMFLTSTYQDFQKPKGSEYELRCPGLHINSMRQAGPLGLESCRGRN